MHPGQSPSSTHGSRTDSPPRSIDTTLPARKAMFQMRGVLADFERSIIRERINSGLARPHSNHRNEMQTTSKIEVTEVGAVFLAFWWLHLSNAR